MLPIIKDLFGMRKVREEPVNTHPEISIPEDDQNSRDKPANEAHGESDRERFEPL